MQARIFDSEYLDALVARAGASPRRRQHGNVHESYADLCQKTFNAIEPSSYVRPHRHCLAPRDETMVAIRGLFALVLFQDNGTVSAVHLFGADAHEDRVAAVVETVAGNWHTVVSMRPGSVMLEVKAGPFDPLAPREFAYWAPEEGTREAEQYLANLQSYIADPFRSSRGVDTLHPNCA